MRNDNVDGVYSIEDWQKFERSKDDALDKYGYKNNGNNKDGEALRENKDEKKRSNGTPSYAGTNTIRSYPDPTRNHISPPRKMSSTSNPVYFVRVGKTGSTSMDKLMPKLLEESGRKYIGGNHFDWSFVQIHERERAAMSHTDGNIDADDGYNRSEYDVSANADVITFLRHPLSRAASQFYFSKGLPWAKRAKARFVQQTFNEWIINPGNFSQPISDGEGGVRYLAGIFKVHKKGDGWVKTDRLNTDYKEYLRQNKTAACLRAAERLDQTAWFGLLEDADRSMKLLQLTLDLDDVPAMPKHNKGRYGKDDPKPSAEAIGIVSKHIPQDLWLYEYATRLFEARWEYFASLNENGDGVYVHPELPPLPAFDNITT